MSTVTSPARGSSFHGFRIGVILGSLAAAVAGSVLLATRDSGEKATTRGVTATLRVPAHPGSVAAGRDALWLGLVDGKKPVRKRPLLRLDLATDTLERSIDIGGQATYLLHDGDRLLASVAHAGSAGSGPSLIVALDWRTGERLVSRQLTGAVGPLARYRKDVWALQTEPAALLRLDARRLTPKAPPWSFLRGEASDWP